MPNINLENYTEEEKQVFMQILSEMKENGSSQKFNQILMDDYSEVPVDISTFLHSPQYLGRALTNGDGKFTLYQYWEDLLKKIYPNPLKPATCNTLALSGAIGIGKSTEGIVIGLYELYRVMCLKNPSIYYGIMQNDTIQFQVINITLEASKQVAWDKLQNIIQMSDWFMTRGTMKGKDKPEWYPDPRYKINLICGSQPRHFIGQQLFWALFDEISFIQNQDVEKQIQKAKELISSATARMQSRFMRNNVNPTILVLASSKRTEQSFLETWIKKKKEEESKTTIIVDEPQWVVRPDKRSDKTFKVQVGNKYLPSEVLPPDQTQDEIDILRGRGYRLVDVPIGYYENFLDDIDIALTDIAGISTTSLSTFIKGENLQTCKIQGQNPFTKDIIEVGNSKDDKQQYSDFFDLSVVPSEMKKKPMFIHLDMSISGDKTGIAGVWIKGKKPTIPGEPETKDMLFQLSFCVSVKQPKGYQVSFEKTRNFIDWLKKSGFNIKLITMDTFQSADMLQQLRDRHYNAEILSVDRIDSDRICKPYQFLKSCINEARILIYKKGTILLTEELLGLERNNNSGKIDHSPSSINSKDSQDQVCGACFSASKHCEEYIYEFGEDLNLIAQSNTNVQYNENFNFYPEVTFKQDTKNDFISGKPVSVYGGVADGIMLW